MKGLRKTAASLMAVLLASGSFSVSAADIDVTRVKISDGFRYTIENNEIVIVAYDDTREPEKVIPEEINGMPVTRINSLWGNVTEIIIPDSVKTIDSKAFRGNFYLEKIVIPESVTSIGEYILEDCEKLVSCDLRADISEIPTGMFWGCSMLSELSYPDDITNICGGAFSGCASLTSIDIPDSMTEIPRAMLRGCSRLSEVTLPDGLVSIGDYAFKDCSSLTEIIIPDGVEYIGEYAFSGCSSVTGFRIPEKVKVISDGMFNDCSSATEIILPEYALSYEEKNSTRVYCRETFRNCSSLTEIELPYGLQNIGEKCFDGCSLLGSIYIPETVTVIDNYAFRNCSSAEEIIVPGYSTIYGKETFAGCTSITSMIIPETVYSFAGGGSASKTFKDCKNLKTLYIPSEADEYYDMYDGCDSLENLYIGNMLGKYSVNHLGYIYDEESDTYTKNEKLTIYCRQDSNLHKYAEKNGFHYEIVEGVESYLSYFATYDDPDDKQESTMFTLGFREPVFINGTGEFKISDRDITPLDNGRVTLYLQNNLDLIVNLGFDGQTYSEVSAEPTYLNFGNRGIGSLYDEVLYETALLEDGYWYLFISCSSGKDIDITSMEIEGSSVDIGFLISNIVEASGKSDTVSGDVNNDGSVTASDIAALMRYLLCAGDTAGISMKNSDINSDGSVNILDLILLKSGFCS